MGTPCTQLCSCGRASTTSLLLLNIIRNVPCFICRSLTSSSLSSCKQSCESSYTEVAEPSANTALQKTVLQQPPEITCDVRQHTALAGLQLQPAMPAAGSVALAVDTTRSKQHVAKHCSYAPVDWSHTGSGKSPHCSSASDSSTNSKDVLHTTSVQDNINAGDVQHEYGFVQSAASVASTSTICRYDEQQSKATALQPFVAEQRLPLLSAADVHRHKQAFKAAQQAYATHKQQLLWAARSDKSSTSV